MIAKFFTLNDDFNTIIENELNDKVILKITPVTTGWTNIVYRVKTNNGNYYFRFPRDIFWEKTIVKDYEFAKYINGKTSFETVKLELKFNNNRPYSMHREIEGIPLAEKMNDLSDEKIEKISNQIAKFMYELHNLKYDENEIFTNSKDIGFELQDFITELLNDHVDEKDKSFWNNNNFVINDKNDRCLVHGDLNSSNILLDENDNVKAIIDFGFAGFGTKYFDISRIIGRCPHLFEKKIITAYQKLENKKINNEELQKDIKIWSNIDRGYINYMERIGIYNT